MTDITKQRTAQSRFLPVGIIVLVVALLGFGIWQVGPSAYSKSNPYLDDLSQNPTGDGSTPEGS